MNSSQIVKEMIDDIRELYLDILINYERHLSIKTSEINRVNSFDYLGEKVRNFLSNENVNFILGLEMERYYDFVGTHRSLFHLSVNFFEIDNRVGVEINYILLPPEEREKGRLIALLDKLVLFKKKDIISGKVYINDTSESNVWKYLKKKYQDTLDIIIVN